MPDVGSPTLDQMRVLITVTETGSFAAAGRRLGRATSAISYTVATLEANLGIQLFDRDQARKPVLTSAGKAVLARAVAITGEIDDLRAAVAGLQQGLEAEVSLAVDVMLPTCRLTDAIRAFEARFPTVTLRLHVETLGAVAELVLDRTARIGIAGIFHSNRPGLEQMSVGVVEMVPVAAPEHPLARPGRRTPGEIRHHRQLVLTVRAPFAEGADAGVMSPKEWRIADLGAKHALLVAGSGWGFMPEPMVHDDVAAGRLARLDLPEVTAGHYPLQAIYRSDARPGPAGEWLIAHFAAQGAGLQDRPAPG